MKILIKVTEEILHRARFCGMEVAKSSKEYVSKNCAIALAVRGIFPDATVTDRCIHPVTKDYVVNGKNGMIVDGLHFDKVMYLPKRAKAFVRLFDYLDSERRVNMKPFSFEVEIPPSVMNEISIGEVYKVLSESRTLELVSI